MKKRDRQMIIKKMIVENEIETQEELMRLLKEKGVKYTQATISRDMRELNIVKSYTKEGHTKYALLAANNEVIEEKLAFSMQEYMQGIDQVEYLVLIYTVSHGADVIANYMDELKFPEIAGTIAGFDLLLIITYSKEHATALVKKLRRYRYE